MQKQIVHIYFKHVFMFTGQIDDWNLNLQLFEASSQTNTFTSPASKLWS